MPGSTRRLFLACICMGTASANDMVARKCLTPHCMNKSVGPNSAPPASVLPQLRDTQDAFDSVAADYDGARGNNDLIQDMRAEMWRWLARTFAPGERLIDLGCGTGLDAVHLAEMGYEVTATDWSPQMVQRTALGQGQQRWLLLRWCKP